MIAPAYGAKVNEIIQILSNKTSIKHHKNELQERLFETMNNIQNELLLPQKIRLTKIMHSFYNNFMLLPI